MGLFIEIQSKRLKATIEYLKALGFIPNGKNFFEIGDVFIELIPIDNGEWYFTVGIRNEEVTDPIHITEIGKISEYIARLMA